MSSRGTVAKADRALEEDPLVPVPLNTALIAVPLYGHVYFDKEHGPMIPRSWLEVIQGPDGKDGTQ